MSTNVKILELLQRAKNVGITLNDFRDFTGLIAKGGDPVIQARIESKIAFRELAQSLRPSLPFVTPPPMQGDIVLGQNLNGQSRYYSKYASSHLLGIGQTGVGKTVFFVFLLLQYLLIASGIFIFDFVKRELRGFKRLAEKVGKEVIICRHENLRVNLLDPQELEPSLYANICSEFIALSLGLPTVAKLVLKICITNLYKKFGLFTNRNALPPIFPELIEEVKNIKGHSAAKEAILIRLKALIINQQQVFSVRRGFKISELAQKIIVWELDSLEMQYQSLFASYLISFLFAYRVAFPTRDMMVIALDEAGRIYSKKAEAANEGPSYISTMTSVVRGMNIAIMAFTQTCYDLSNSIIANSGIKVLFRVGTVHDYDMFGRTMGLSADQIQFCKTSLGVGQNVIKMGFGYMEPFLNKCPLVVIPQNVSDTEVHQSVQQLLDMDSSSVEKPLLLTTDANESFDTDEKDNTVNNLTADEQALFEQLKKDSSTAPATEHYKAAGLSTKRGVVAKQSLTFKKIIKETVLESGKRGAAITFLEIIKSIGTGRNGGTLHNFLRGTANTWYIAKNCKTEIEKAIVVDGQNKFIDLAVIWPDRRIEAVEIETEFTQRAIENIRKNISAGFDIISVLTPNSKVRQAIENVVENEIGSPQRSIVKFPSIAFYK
jgi:hypothetical protein